MKVWKSFGSEHSAGLVLIGKFRDTGKAKQVSDIFNKLCEHFSGRDSFEEPVFQHTEEDLEVLQKFNASGLRPEELEQFNGMIHHNLEDNFIRIRTDEADLSAYIRLMVIHSGKVEIYSDNDYPDEEGEGSEV